MGFILGLRSLGTSHPPRQDGKEETERVWWGKVGGGIRSSSLAPTLPLSLTYTHLCPSLSICLAASFLL